MVESKIKDGISKFELNSPSLFKLLIKKNSEFVDPIIKIARKAEHYLDNIPTTFPEYTLHNIDHSIRIIDYMSDLIPNIEGISDLEITVLITIALLHDIGMYCSIDEKSIIVGSDDFIYSMDFNSIKENFNGSVDEALRYVIRKNHAIRSSEMIIENFSDLLIIPAQPSTSYVTEISQICLSHNERFDWITDNLETHAEKGSYSFNPQFCAVLLRLSDIIDFDSQRTPPDLYKLINPKGFGKDEWKKHFIIDNRDKIKDSIKRSDSKRIVLIGKCDDIAIHRKVLEYLKWINQEILSANILSGEFDKLYFVNIEYPLENKIKTVGFSASDLELNVDYKAISKLLMGDNLYKSKDLGLRELIQNGIDACLIKKEIINKKKKFGDDNYQPKIKVILNENQNEVIIEDNGIGMTKEILEKYYLSIGKSYYCSDDFRFMGIKYNTIGSFGIGFLSAFMLSGEVTIITRHHSTSTMYTISLAKDSEFVCMNETEEQNFQGTKTILNYNEFMEIFNNDKDKIKKFILKYFITDTVDIEFIDIKTEEKTPINNSIVKTTTNLEELNELKIANYVRDIEGTLYYSKANNLGQPHDYFTKNLYYFNNKNLEEVIIDDFDFNTVYSTENNTFNYLRVYYFDSESIHLLDDIIPDGKTLNYNAFLKNDPIHSLNHFDILIDNNIIDKFRLEYFYQNNEIRKDANPYLILDYNSDRNFIPELKSLTKRLLNECNELQDYPSIIFRYQLSAFLCDIKNYLVPLFRNEYDRKVLKDRRELYLRNVLVDDWEIGSKKDGFLQIHSCKLNVVSSLISPDITRNKLSKEANNIIVDTLKAIPYISDMENNDEYSMDHKKAILRFLNNYLPKYKLLLKKNKKDFLRAFLD